MSASGDFDAVLAKLTKDSFVQSDVDALRSNLAAEKDIPLNEKNVEKVELDLASLLAIGTARAHQSEAVRILETLIEKNTPHIELCFLWLAVARYLLGEFREARLTIEKLLLRKPDDVLARRVLEAIRTRVKRDGLSGLAIVFAVAVISAMAGSYFGHVRRSTN